MNHLSAKVGIAGLFLGSGSQKVVLQISHSTGVRCSDFTDNEIGVCSSHNSQCTQCISSVHASFELLGAAMDNLSGSVR
jgi:hypothetical protein